MSGEALVTLSDVKQQFPVKVNGRRRVLTAVNGVSLQVHKGETFGLVGESGCGKSTLGKTLLRLYPLTGGTIQFDGADISTLRGQELKHFRCKAQMIFQDPSSCLNPRRKIRDIMLEPFIIHHMLSPQQRKDRLAELCDMVGLSSQYLERYPHELSGGQKQRIGIARALALNPGFIVCDEPVSALDVSIQAQVINLLEDLQKQFSLTYLFISHNLSVVKHTCQRIAVMYLGRIVELADAGRLFENPLHPYTQALISAIPSTEEGTDGQRILLKGDLPSPISPPGGCAFHTRCPYAFEPCGNIAPSLAEVEAGHLVACHLRIPKPLRLA